VKTFPLTFVAQTAALNNAFLNQADGELIDELARKGYVVQTGLTRAYADDIARMCRQPSIKEYCPNDAGRRFTNQIATEQWLTKGRLTFLLLKKDEAEFSLAGYGWSGAEISPHVLTGQTTFALRVGEGSQGQGLATPFARLILATTASLQHAENFWLETWLSDGAAVHIYHKLGFKDVEQVNDRRPTVTGNIIDDIRIYMSLPNNLLK
jgi:ribosomal protein S18 acetylase RimI-like enzyme